MDSVNIKKNTDRKYHHQNLKEELLSCARTVLDEEGIDKVSIRYLARKLGVAHSAPANHFKTKKDLLTALATEIFNELANKISNTLAAQSNSVQDSIHSIAQIVLEYGLEHPNGYKLIWRRDLLNNDAIEINHAMDRIYHQLLEVLEQQENATVSSTSKETKAIALWSLIHGYVTMRLEGILEPKRDELSGQDRQVAIIDALIGGIC